MAKNIKIKINNEIYDTLQKSRTRQFDDPVVEQLYTEIDDDFQRMLSSMMGDILEVFKSDKLEKSGIMAGGTRAQHKYLKRTGAPGHYRYWYMDDKGQTYHSDKSPHTNLFEKIVEDRKKVIVRPKDYTSENKQHDFFQGWEASEKFHDTVTHPKYGTISVQPTEDNLFVVRHNYSMIKDKSGVNRFANKADAQKAAADYAKAIMVFKSIPFNIEPLLKASSQRANHKYIKRTGGPGSYRYWYKDDKGHIYEGKNAPENFKDHDPKSIKHNFDNSVQNITSAKVNFNEAHEEWRPIQDLPKYEVSNTGRVRNKETKQELKQQNHIGLGKKNYKRVSIINNEGKKQNKRVHRLVAQEFLSNPDAVPEVNHKDRNTSNNDVNNLEYVSQSQNQRHWRELAKQSKKKGLEARPPKTITVSQKPSPEPATQQNIPVRSRQDQILAEVNNKLRKPSSLALETKEGVELMKSYNVNPKSSTEEFYTKVKNNVTNSQHFAKICSARLDLYHNIKLAGNWSVKSADVVKNFEDFANILPRGHVANNDYFEKIKHHKYVEPEEGSQAQKTYAHYDPNNLSIDLSDKAMHSQQIGGDLRARRQFRDVFSHEIGHAVSNKLRELNPEGYNEIAKLSGWSPQAAENHATGDEKSVPQDLGEKDHITDYASKSAEENFAELYALYTLNAPTINDVLIMKDVHPTEYKGFMIRDSNGSWKRLSYDTVEQFRAIKKHVFIDDKMKKAFASFAEVLNDFNT